MQTIQHKTFGRGEVISKEVRENDIYITVRFDSGKEMKFAAKSFEMGLLVAERDLKEEIAAVLAAKNAEEEARRNAIKVASATTPPIVVSTRGGRQPKRRVAVKGPIQTQYEAYLQAAGYCVVGCSGNPSTVSFYVYAIEQVLKEEKLTWTALKKNIAQIVTKYEVGGGCEEFGAKSNRTVINALKRFAEFV